MSYKIFVENYNGVLNGVEDIFEERGQLTDNYHEADAFLLWQDVRGPQRELADIAKHQLKKPVLVLQHGRGATRDYCPPNKFPLIADKILVWGDAERDRLLEHGMSRDKVTVVGCPLLGHLKQKSERRGKNALFVPVIGQKEEPENILVHAAMKIWESEKLIETINRNFNDFKRAWAWEENILKEVGLPDGTMEKRLWKKETRNILPRWLTYGAGLVNVKLAGIHDSHQYQSPQIITQQNDPDLVDILMELLTNIDVMVCLEEGTMQLLACAMDIPIILVDVFRYGNYGGCPDYDRVEKIRTKSCYRVTDINKLGRMMDIALANPKELAKHRRIVCEIEGGINQGNADANIIREVEACMERKRAGEYIKA